MATRKIMSAALRAERAGNLCAAWNAKHSIGQRVKLLKDGGQVIETTTRSEAEVLSGHTAVIWLDGVAGCYDLERVKAIDVTCIGCGASGIVDAASHSC